MKTRERKDKKLNGVKEMEFMRFMKKKKFAAELWKQEVFEFGSLVSYIMHYLGRHHLLYNI